MKYLILFKCLLCVFYAQSTMLSIEETENPQGLLQQGIELSSQGDFQTSLGFFFKALPILKTKDYRLYLDCLNQISQSYWRLGTLDSAEVYALQAKSLADNYPPQKVQSFNNLGVVRIIRGDFSAAISHLNEAVSIIENEIEKSDKIQYANTLQVLAIAYKNRGDNFHAIKQLEKSIRSKIDTLGRFDEQLISAYTEAANIWRNIGNYDSASFNINAALDISRNNEGNYSHAYFEAGVIYSLKHEYALGLEYFQQALVLINSSPSIDLITKAHPR